MVKIKNMEFQIMNQWDKRSLTLSMQIIFVLLSIDFWSWVFCFFVVGPMGFRYIFTQVNAPLESISYLRQGSPWWKTKKKGTSVVQHNFIEAKTIQASDLPF